MKLIMLITMIGFSAQAQVSQAWVKKFGPTRDQAANSIAIGSDGNVYVGGNSHLIKYTPNGAKVWESETGSRFFVASNYIYTANIDGAGQAINLAKINLSGTIEWQVKYSDPNSDWNEPKVFTERDGFIYVACLGGTQTGNNYNVVLLKYNSDGVMQFNKTFDGLLHRWDEPTGMTIDLQGNIIVTGRTQSQDEYSTETFIIKYNDSGDEIWPVRYFDGVESSDNWTVPSAIATDNQGNIYLTGYTGYFSGHYKSDIFILKYSPDGQLLRSNSFDGAHGGSDWDVDKPIDLVIGSTGIFIPGYVEAENGTDWAVVKYDFELKKIWADYTNVGAPSAIDIDDRDNVYLTGYTIADYFNYNYLTVSYDSDGNLRWQKVYNSFGVTEDKAKAIIVYGDGVFVTGYALDRANQDYLTIRYTQSDATSLSDQVAETPHRFDISQNYPNPFNPITTITFELPERLPVNLVIFTLEGKVVATLVNETLSAGRHSLVFDGSELSSGPYFYKIRAGNLTKIKKMLLLK